MCRYLAEVAGQRREEIRAGLRGASDDARVGVVGEIRQRTDEHGGDEQRPESVGAGGQREEENARTDGGAKSVEAQPNAEWELAIVGSWT